MNRNTSRELHPSKRHTTQRGVYTSAKRKSKQKTILSILGVGVGRNSSGKQSLFIMATTLFCIVTLFIFQGYHLFTSFYEKQHYLRINTETAKGGTEADFGKRREEALLMLQTLVHKSEEDGKKEVLDVNHVKHTCNILPKIDNVNINNGNGWTNHLSIILNATRFPDDEHYMHKQWTLKLLQELSPYIVQQQQQHSLVMDGPNHAVEEEQIGHFLSIVSRRIVDHLDRKMSSTSKIEGKSIPPPLKIAVVGGAIAEGRECVESLKNPSSSPSSFTVGVPPGSIMANPSFCAWPFRLESFLNSFLGLDHLVKVTSLAEEGTDLAFATSLFKNRMLPPSLLQEDDYSNYGPDVVIVAYERREYTFDGNGAKDEKQLMKDFVDAVEGLSCHHSPLVFHLDDFDLTGDASRDKEKSADGHYKEKREQEEEKRVLLVRYANAVNQVLKSNKGALSSSSLFGIAGHVMITWILAHALAETVLQYCSSFLHSSTGLDRSTLGAKNTNGCSSNSKDNIANPCTFAWFASPKGTVTKPSEINTYVAPFVVENTGWNAASDMTAGFSRKTGLVSTIPGARLSIEFRNIQKEIRYLNLMTLKSNHVKWRDGKVRFHLLVNPNVEGVQAHRTTFDIDGWHDVDITYHFEVDLEEGNKAPVGSDVMLQMELVAGEGFKIMGIMLCS